jgi:hypothetical protein
VVERALLSVPEWEWPMMMSGEIMKIVLWALRCDVVERLDGAA